ncbi:hypothetical protein [Geotalea toluenoxydans]|uniref:hypothetical protein n=1 Tax=Geotalea toluenoxydans TaxID=421624 RepID=UPI001FB3F2E0|nr:hypothetical protein [Geotalea toluenoxydans]
MTAVRKDQWVQKDLADSLSLPYSSTPNNDPNSVRKLVRIKSSDYQDGIVGKTLPEPLQVLALDGANRPVKNVQVVFRSIAGGGLLGPDATTDTTAGASEYRIATGADGIARAYLMLGTKTADSPYFIMQNKPYAVQVGQNMVNVQADISSGALATDKPFEAYAFPGDAVNIVKVAENTTDNKWGLPGLFAGSIWVLVTDVYGNPISNKEVTFSVEEQVYRLNPQPFETPNAKIHNARLLRLENSCPGSPTLDCADSMEQLQVTSNITGAVAEVLLGNTDGTDFTITANALKDENGTETSTPLQPVSFTYHSYGITERSDDTAATYLTASVVHHFDSRGNRIDAGKAGTVFPQPLTVTLYRSEETTVSAIKDNCSTACYYLKGTGIFQTSKVNDGTVSFSISQGGGSVSPAVVPASSNGQTPNTIIDGIYESYLTLGQAPALNVISVLASTSSLVKHINTSTGETFSKSKTLTTETSLNIWGVLPRLEPDQWILINSKGYPTADVPLRLSVKPDEYPVGSLAVRFYENGLWGYMGEVPVQRAGGVLSAGGAVFDPRNSYQAKLVLFDSQISNVESDPVPIKVVAVDLAIDSENTSGLNPDGTHKDPQRTVHSEVIEDAPDQPGKYIPLNERDINNNKILDFADGYDLTSSQPTDNGSAAFVPILLEIPEPIDTTQAQVRFIYNASDPAGVTQSTTGEYLPAPGGHIRLWNKDGIKGRQKASLANGGNYIKPGDILNTSQLGDPIAPGVWRLYVEGVTSSTQLGEESIRMDIDPDGNGPSPFMMADEVRATVNKPLLITDYNRDRVIDDKDRLRAALGNTFYFWVNDDMDSGDISEDSDTPEYRTTSQILSLKNLNGKDSKVNGTRDLEDFFPVYLDLQEMLAKFTPSAFDYVLKQGDSALNLAFPGLNDSKTGLNADESGKYLTDATENGVAKGLAEKETFKVTKTGIRLNDHPGNPSFLQNIIAEKKESSSSRVIHRHLIRWYWRLLIVVLERL